MGRRNNSRMGWRNGGQRWPTVADLSGGGVGGWIVEIGLLLRFVCDGGDGCCCCCLGYELDIIF